MISSSSWNSFLINFVSKDGKNLTGIALAAVDKKLSNAKKLDSAGSSKDRSKNPVKFNSIKAPDPPNFGSLRITVNDE